MSHSLHPGLRLLVASHNQGKVREIRDLLAPYGLDVRAASELDLPEPEETEKTFAGNARLKAVAAAKASRLPALSDDSGLEVAGLGGRPGIYSARWAGPTKDFQSAMARVHDELAAAGVALSDAGVAAGAAAAAAAGDGAGREAMAPDVMAPDVVAGNAVAAAPGGAEARRANFTCALCLAWPDGAAEIFEGKVFGTLVWPPRGSHGFGYDPMFQPDGHDITFGEMEPAAKQAMSHRAKAFELFVAGCLKQDPA